MSKKYDPATVEEMKLMGLDKPEDCSWGDWIGPKNINHRHKFLIGLAVMGLSNKAIAEEMGMTEARISVILSNSEVQREIEEKRKLYWDDKAEERFKKILPEAITVAHDILKDRQEGSNLRADIAFKFMDRALGKPKQQMEIKDSSLSDFIDALEKLPRDVTGSTETKSLDKPKDKFDNFIDEFIPEEVVVGKKGDPEEL